MSLRYRPRTQTTYIPGTGWVTTQDCEPIVEHNKKLNREPQKSDWGRHVGSVPNNLINQWLLEYSAREGIFLPRFTPHFWRFCRRKLEDPNYKYLRVDHIKPSQVTTHGAGKLL